MATPQRRRWDLNGWRAPLLKTLLAIGLVLATWWTRFAWERFQEMPKLDQQKAWEKHRTEEYPALREQVLLLNERQNVLQGQILTELVDIRKRLPERR